MARNKILLVAPYNAKKVGGIGTWTKNILDYAKRQNDQIVFLNSALRFRSTIVKSRFNRMLFGILETTNILTRLLYKLITSRPRVVHYTSSASFALYKDMLAIYLSRLLGAKFVIHFRFGRIPELRKNKNREWTNLCRVIRTATQVIVIDDASYNALIEEGFKNVYDIPNPISLELQSLAQNISTDMADRIKGSVLFVGHVIPAKGVTELVSACCNLKQVKLLNIIGPYNKEYRDKLKTIAKQRGNGEWLHFVGQIPFSEIIDYYLTTNIFVLPSHTEGFPNVILEAMALACPIIATPVGAIPQMLDINAAAPSGTVVPVQNAPELENAIAMLLQDIAFATKLSSNAHDRVLFKYTLDKSYSQLQRLWKL